MNTKEQKKASLDFWKKVVESEERFIKSVMNTQTLILKMMENRAKEERDDS